MAREGVALNAAQAYVFEILEPILVSTAGVARGLRARRAFAARGRPLPLARAGRDDRALRRRGRGAVLHAATSPTPSSTGSSAGGGQLTRADLAAYEPDRARAGARDLPRARRC